MKRAALGTKTPPRQIVKAGNGGGDGIFERATFDVDYID
jgi:hypothetical protein